MRFPLLVLAAALALSAGAQVYKWTDSSGKVHYGDKPPDDANKREVRINVQSYDGPAQVSDWSAILKRKPEQAAAGPRPVTMYATDWCGVCRRARAYFNDKGIRYTEVNIETSEAGRREYTEAGGTGAVPLIIVGGKAMRGFSEANFERIYGKS